MSAFAEKKSIINISSFFEENGRAVLRYTAVAMATLFLVYYCIHPDLYTGMYVQNLFQSSRTYVMAGMTFLLLIMLMIPNEMSSVLNRRISAVWFAAAPIAVYFSLYYMNAEKFDIHFFELNKIAVVFTFVFLYLVQSLLFCLTGSIRWSVILYAVAIAVLGIANCFVISFRGMALSAADLFSIETAMAVADEYTYKLDWYMFMELFCTFAICTVSLKLKGGRMMHPVRRMAVLILCGLLSSGYYYICCKTDFLERNDIRSTGFTHQLRYKQFDMLFTTLCTCFYLSADKPEGYSTERVEAIAEQYTETVEGSDHSEESKAPVLKGQTQPNLIIIMNESWADYSEIGRGLALSEDCMPFIHGLTENTIKGNAYASIFGGNTPNSEYEFLTGNTMGFLPESSVGFNLFVRGEMPTLASQLKSQGYETLAMHPYRGENYRRHIVYPQIGFDTYYTREDFAGADYIRNYISDQSLAERIIQEYEEHLQTGMGKPLLSYNVSIQNHGGYYSSNVKNMEMKIQVLNEGIDHTKAEIYVNLVRETDDMFRNLVNYFGQQQEPTAILMFGDHQANIGDSTYQYLIGNEENCTPEERMEKYKVPFLIWTNYDIKEETVEKTSLNYLYPLMADRLNLPMTGYQKYLRNLREEIPVLNSLGYWTSEGSFYELDDKMSPYYDRINEYHILEYNYIFGQEDRNLNLFSMKSE